MNQSFKCLFGALILASAVVSPLTSAANKIANIGYLFQNTVPVGIPSSGSFGTNGALTGLTALPQAYPGIYLFFPANTICSSGQAAGFYWTVMSSTTTGTVYNAQLAASGHALTVSSPTAFACTGIGAYTQSTSAQSFLSFAYSGGYVGAYGALGFYSGWSVNNSANNKTLNVQLSGTNVLNAVVTTIASYDVQQYLWNVGSQAIQSITTANGPSSSANTYATINTATNGNVTLTATLANASDYIVLESLTVTGYPQYQ